LALLTIKPRVKVRFPDNFYSSHPPPATSGFLSISSRWCSRYCQGLLGGYFWKY